MWATLTSVNWELCFHFSTWYNAHKLTWTKNMPFKFTLLRNAGGHRGVSETRIPCYALAVDLCYYVQSSFVFSLPHALQAPVGSLCKCADCLRVKWKPRIHTQSEKEHGSSQSFKAKHHWGCGTSRNIPRLWRSSRPSEKITLDCVRNTFFQGYIERDIYQERYLVGQHKPLSVTH